MAFHILPGLQVIAPSELALPRSQQLYSAIKNHPEYKLIEVLRVADEAKPRNEYLIVDVTCDQVPSRNPYGILYRERLALEVLVDEKQLVNVLALRQGFPVLLHQFQTRLGSPAWLCLYVDSPNNVLRTWTPQNFLKRIIWWLKKSANGELHQSEQPVEGLFFSTPFELVLPWDFFESQAAGKTFTFFHGPERPDKGVTFFAVATADAGSIPRAKTIATVEIELPPIVHGQVEQDPFTMGELVNLFQTKGIDLIDRIKKKLKIKDGEMVSISDDMAMVLFLIYVPMKKDESSEPEGISRRAFIVPIGPIALGLEIGFLVRNENNALNDYFKSIDMGDQASWRNRQISSLMLQYYNNAAASRHSAGLQNAGPQGLLVGVGALGGAMLDIWVRSGWGSWTAIDADHLKPHNLARHIGVADDIGMPKAHVAVRHSYSISEGAVSVNGIPIDGCDFLNNSLLEAHKKASLVVDASTTLDYPRLASMRDDVSRHMSVYITLNGNSAVLLAEDKFRAFRLRTLEAQYYRALINHELGNHELCGSQGTFISGSSCRDISTVMPYSKILNHASTLSEQVMLLSLEDFALIKIWNRNQDTGSVDVYELKPEAEIYLEIEELHVYLDNGLEKKLKLAREGAFPNETGGILLGYYDFNIKAIFIVDILAAPQDSASTPVSFQRGVQGTIERLQEVQKSTMDMVGYIGEWHSHPLGHTSKPSPDDYYQIIFLALGMAEDGLPAISLIIGEDGIQILKCEAK